MALGWAELGLWRKSLEDGDLTQQDTCRPSTLLKRVRSEFGPHLEGACWEHWKVHWVSFGLFLKELVLLFQPKQFLSQDSDVHRIKINGK